MLTTDQVWAAVDAHRRRVVDLLEDLTDDEWRRPSLCDGWRVKDVAAHLILQEVGWAEAVRIMIRFRGDAGRAIKDSARELAAELPTREVVARLRAMIGSRRRNAGVTPRDTLIDALVHGHDIAIPLDRPLETDPAAAAEVTTRMWTTRFPRPFPATRVLKEFRVVATDVDWSGGAGSVVEAPIEAIMLVSCGRWVALPRLAGPGAAALAEALRAN